MTQSELAGSTGIRPSTVSDMCCNNCRFLKLENIDKICSRLDCKIEDLIVRSSAEKEHFNEGTELI